MRLGLRAYLKQKLRAKSKFFALGIAIQEDAVFFVALCKEKSGLVKLVHEKVVSAHNWSSQLQKWVNRHELSGTPTYLAYSISWYQLFQFDRPAVEESEMTDALRWSVNELLGSNEERAIDYFDLPVPMAGNKKVNVVALKETAVEEAVSATFAAGLDLKSISVEEMVTCNLLPADKDPVLMLVQDAADEVCLNIVKDGDLYFSRRLKGFENLSSFSPEELRMGIVDSLCVQIQRSMDYFESQLRQAPVRQIKIKLDTQHLDTLIQQIEQAVPAKIELLTTGIEIPESINESRLSYTAVGAAMEANLHFGGKDEKSS